MKKNLLAIGMMLFAAPVYADDTSAKISEMIADLGNSKQNNGIEQKCMNGGTKKITITQNKRGTTYDGVYKKCKEPGRVRDGNVRITLGG